jgi:dienelactone hydrolase
LRIRWWKPVAAVVVLGATVVALLSLTGPRLDVDAPVLADRPLTVSVRGIAAGSTVEVGVVADDAIGQSWQASAPAVVDEGGELTLLKGDLTDLVTSMAVIGSRERRFAWRAPDETAAAPITFSVLLAVEGRPAAARRFERSLHREAVTPLQLSLAEDGVVGELWTAGGTGGPGPGVVVVGGSEGGLAGTEIAPLLASHGLPTLGIALFGHPGLPETLHEVPLEPLAAAVSALAARPEVDERRVWVLGVSRGSEAALLAALAWPELVHGVVAAVPNAVALCSLPDCDEAAWTLEGQPVPTTSQVATAEPTDEPDAVIEIERFDGPLVTICGGWDEVWPSYSFADALADRRAAAGVDDADLALAYPRAGHAVGTLVPLQPGSTALDDRDELARRELWPQLLDQLTTG